MRRCGSTSLDEQCVLERGHEDDRPALLTHIDQNGREWPAHVPAPGGMFDRRGES